MKGVVCFSPLPPSCTANVQGGLDSQAGREHTASSAGGPGSLRSMSMMLFHRGSQPARGPPALAHASTGTRGASPHGGGGAPSTAAAAAAAGGRESSSSQDGRPRRPSLVERNAVSAGGAPMAETALSPEEGLELTVGHLPEGRLPPIVSSDDPRLHVGLRSDSISSFVEAAEEHLLAQQRQQQQQQQQQQQR